MLIISKCAKIYITIIFQNNYFKFGRNIEVLPLLFKLLLIRFSDFLLPLKTSLRKGWTVLELAVYKKNC